MNNSLKNNMEERIKLYIAIYGGLILAMVATEEWVKFTWFAGAVFCMVKYIYLCCKED